MKIGFSHSWREYKRYVYVVIHCQTCLKNTLMKLGIVMSLINIVSCPVIVFVFILSFCLCYVLQVTQQMYYLHQVCHSWTILVHGIVPEVYYLHEVCHSCTNLVHGIVLQEQWIWAIRDVLFHRLTRKFSKRSNAVWETYPPCETTASRARTLAFIERLHCLTPQLIGRLHLVLGTSFLRQAPYPMMPYGRGYQCSLCVRTFIQCHGMDYSRQAHFM